MAAPLQLTNAIGAGTVRLKQCSIADTIVPGTFKVLENKHSASPTIIAFGELQKPLGISGAVWATLNKSVAMKCSFPKQEPTDYGLLVEVDMYKAVAELVRRNYTPNIVLYIDSWRCTVPQLLAGMPPEARAAFTRAYFSAWSLQIIQNRIAVDPDNETLLALENNRAALYRAIKKMEDDLRKNTSISDAERQRRKDEIAQAQIPYELALQEEELFESQLKIKAAEKHMETDVVNVLLTEKSQGTSLMQIVQDKLATEEELFAILFQVIFTLHILAAIGIRQADLHTGNVFVDPFSPAGAQFAYVLEPEAGKHYYLVPAKHIIKIYDWDFGGIYDPILGFPAIKNLEMIQHNTCASQSACGRNAKADLYRVLLFVYRRTAYPKIKAFIEKVININLLSRDNSHFDALCKILPSERGLDIEQCPPRTKIEPELGFQWGRQCDNTATQGWEPPACWVLSPAEALRLPEFARWHKRFTGRPLETPYVYGLWTHRAPRERYVNPPAPTSFIDTMAGWLLSSVIE